MADWEEEVSARWEELTQLYSKLTRRYVHGTYQMEYHYKVQLASGQSKSFGGWLGERLDRSSRATRLVHTPGVTTPVTVEQLGRLLDREVSRAQLPLALNRFNAGQPVTFGPLTVTRNSIAAGDQSALWSDIEGVQTKSGTVFVKKAGKWLPWKTVRVSEIPNYSVFEALVRAVLAQTPSAPER